MSYTTRPSCGRLAPRQSAGSSVWIGTAMPTRQFLEFFAATIRNRNTRMAYYRAVRHFFAWSEHHRLGGLDDIEPLQIAAYVEQLQASMAKPSAKQYLAALRVLFDWLLTGQVLATNPTGFQ